MLRALDDARGKVREMITRLFQRVERQGRLPTGRAQPHIPDVAALRALAAGSR